MKLVLSVALALAAAPSALAMAPFVTAERPEEQSYSIKGKSCKESSIEIQPEECDPTPTEDNPDGDYEGMVCANDGEGVMEAYCSHVPDFVCARCTDLD